MAVHIDEKDTNKLILIGDRVLIKPKNPDSKTKSGLILPPSVHEKEKMQTGYIVKVGPGYPIPAVNEADEVWKQRQDNVQYVPLQAEAGDLAVYMQSAGNEITFNGEKYILIPHSAILMLVRDDSLFE